MKIKKIFLVSIIKHTFAELISDLKWKEHMQESQKNMQATKTLK